MDGHRFDDLTRALATSSDRRRLLRGLIPAALVVLAGRPRSAGAQTSCPAGQVNRRGIGCVCRSTGRPPVSGGCPCTASGDCPTGQTCCGGLCVDTQTNPSFCGSCDIACETGPLDACCGGVCTDLFSNETHCGACFNACAVDEICSADDCCVEVGGDCTIDEDCCFFFGDGIGPICCDGTCTDIQRDEQNCGACNFVCPEGLICGGGGASPGECCGSALDNAACVTDDDCCFDRPCCGGVCTETFANEDHCGACFNACDADEQCRGVCCGNPGSPCTVADDCCFGCNTGAGECLDA